MRKEIYASLAIADHEIRILISEFHNGRLNILKIERVEHDGIVDNVIVDELEIISAIKKGFRHIEANLQFKILRVLLLVNSKNYQRTNQTLKSDVNDPLSRVQLDNIQHIYQQAMNLKPLVGLELINIEIYRYKLNGAYIRKSPVNEKTHRLYADVDFYYVDRDYVYQLANIVEKAGLEILDVCLDSFAIGKEAGLLNKKPDEYVIGVNIERHATTLSLYYNQRLLHCETIETGIERFIHEISKSLNIPKPVATRLMFGNVDFSDENPTTYPIYLWSQNKKSYTCSQRDLMEIIEEASNELFDIINVTSQPIYESGQTSYVITGEGSMLKGIDHALKAKLGYPVESYLPSTLGARDGALVSSLGAFYAYIDHHHLQNYQETSVSLVDYEEAINVKIADESDTSLSTRLKSFLKEPIKGGNYND